MNSQRFLQTEFWAEFKGSHGWRPYYFAVSEKDFSLRKLENFGGDGMTSGEDEFLLSVMVRQFSLGIKKVSLAYIPMAPEGDAQKQKEYFDSIAKISENLRNFLPKNTLFVRFDPPMDFDSVEGRSEFVKTSAKVCGSAHKSFVDIQPPDTVLLPLEKTEDEILAQMKNKWRYNIRLAAKKGVEVSRHYSGDADFETSFEEFYRLFEITSKRDGVSFHGKNYYRDLLSRSAKRDGTDRPLITLYLAKHEEDYLAGIITLFCPREGVYLYGASGNIKRNLMAAYLLQWTAIQDAKKYGCPVYDFYGMPPTDDPNHPMHGLYLFKTGFGGNITHRAGSYDIPLKPFMYSLYSVAEKLRAWWHKKLIKKISGR